MVCINKTSKLYLNTYDYNNPKIIEIASSIGEKIHSDCTESDYYYVQISNEYSFKFFNLTEFIPKKTLGRITKKKNAFLVIDNSLEYYVSVIPSIYEYLVEKHKIDPAQIILITSVPTMHHYVDEYCKQHNYKPIKIEWLPVFEKMGKDTITKVTYDIHKSLPIPEKRFLNLNRRWRLHRPFIVTLLHDRSLINSGYISLGEADDSKGWIHKYNELLLTYKHSKKIYDILLRNKSIIEMPPMYLDTDDLKTNRADHENSINNYYYKTAFSVITETTYHESIPFFSEKTFKAIAMKHPFILATAPNSLQYLKNLGYKTYHPFIDESYDTIEDHGCRMIAIVDEIERLCNLSNKDFNCLKEKLDKISEFNYNVLNNKKIKVKRLNF